MNAKQERLPVRVKGRGDSLWVTIDPTQPIDYLQTQLDKIFKRFKHLTVNARIVIDQSGKENDHLYDHICVFLKETFHVGVVSKAPTQKKPAFTSPVSKRKEEATSSGSKRKMIESWQKVSSDALIIAGRIRSGQKVTTNKHLIILGDVNPGAEVMAGGDIHVMGTLRGTGIAGQPDNEDAIILALDFCPTQIQIGGFVAAGLPPSQQKGTEYAEVESGAIVVKDYLKANPFGQLPTPQVR